MGKIIRKPALDVEIAREVNGIEMGVLSDGRAYFTGRGLARLCGAAASTIINQSDRWLTGDRSNRLAQMLVNEGLDRESLYETVYQGDKKVHAYPEDICMAVLEYFGWVSKSPIEAAQRNFRKLARAGLRLFVYHALGWDPMKRVSPAWRTIHDRLLLHKTPRGYFSVFKEAVDFELAMVRAGLPYDHNTIPDISMGQTWGPYWVDNVLHKEFGQRIRHDHHYPDSYPQSASNPQEIWVYPIAALGVFREWLETTYIPSKFPNYLKGKVAKGILPASTAELILVEVMPPQLAEAT